MALADISIRRPVFAWMLMAGLILFGAISYSGLGISQLPDVDFPVVSINLSYPGAAPEVMESSVVDPIEDAVTSIEGVQKVTSASLTGSATVTVEFELGRDIDLALQDVQAKVEQARRMLPVDLDPPVINKTNPEDQPIIWLALQGPGIPLRELSRYVQDELKGQFATVPGVGDIRLGGFQEPALRIWVDPEKLLPWELTITDVVDTVRKEHLEPPGGYVDYQGNELTVRAMGEASDPKDFRHIFITTRGGAANFNPIPITRVATVEKGLEDVRRIARSNGTEAVGLGIQKQRGANAVAVARGVKERLAEVQQTLPKGMKLEIRNDTTRFIEESVEELILTLVLSAILTALVCWLFLGSWSATLNVLLAIPTSVIGAFTALYFLGFTLNTFTLLALSLSIGIVVDDAIMVLENIARRREMGEPKIKAALLGARQITFAATAATVSILAIFLPVAFMKGIIGKFFLQFGITLSVAVLLSLIEALTITPMRSAAFLQVGERTSRLGKGVEKTFELLKHSYARTLGWAIAHRWMVLGAATLIFGASILCLRGLNQEFLPAEDRSQFMLRVKLPEGVALGTTSAEVAKIEAYLMKQPWFDSYFAAVGGFSGGEVNQAMIFINMKPKGERGETPELGDNPGQYQVMNFVRDHFSKDGQMQVIAQDLSARGFTASRGFPVEFSITGTDWKGLSEHSKKIMKEMRDSGLVTDLDTDFQERSSELAMVPNRAAAERRGVSVEQIMATVSAAFGGLRAARYTEEGRRYDVWVKAVEQPKRDPMKRVANLRVRNNRGEVVPLTEVVHVVPQDAPKTLNRLNRQRAITVFANVAQGKSQADALNLAQRLGQNLPKGYRLEISGTAETFRESFQSLVFALIVGIAIAYMVLATQFNSFADPVTVLSALPFSLTGAFAALLFTGMTLNIYSMIGLLLLMGIVKKNSILLVEFTNQVRDTENLKRGEALLHACPVRLRPILMTSIATIAGAIPAAVAFGPGAEARQPMAISIIGGVLVSTLLTLYVVPCLYTFLSRKERSHRNIEEILKESA